jgi:hypothetical protein
LRRKNSHLGAEVRGLEIGSKLDFVHLVVHHQRLEMPVFSRFSKVETIFYNVLALSGYPKIETAFTERPIFSGNSRVGLSRQWTKST